jgi:2-polyprenyl-3-methyl-5-hydroxy-6-metoxy-1,4-benzoquinol methylase
MSYAQQKQTKFFFEKDAKNWSRKSDFKKNKILNTIQERNFYVLNQAKKYKLKTLLDIGCGSGDLCFEAAKFMNKSVGIDFSNNMIKIANKNFKRKNLKFLNEDFLEFKLKEKFEIISANGFIEYISINDIKKFLKISKNLLTKNGYLTFGTRNKLFNLFSLNKFSLNEYEKKKFGQFYKESIWLNNLSLKKFINLKSQNINKASSKQPKTGINVDVRHQFSPLQIIGLLKKENFKVIDFFPINYHPVPPSQLMTDIERQKFSNYIYYKKVKNKLPFIPFSSSFMVLAKAV